MARLKRWLLLGLLGVTVVVATGMMYGLLLGLPGRPGILIPERQDMTRVLADITGVSIVADGAQPPNYTVEIDYSLRNGCESPGEPQVRRVNRVIEIKQYVEKARTAPEQCSPERRALHVTVPLGNDFSAGETYRIEINGSAHSLVGR